MRTIKVNSFCRFWTLVQGSLGTGAYHLFISPFVIALGIGMLSDIDVYYVLFRIDENDAEINVIANTFGSGCIILGLFSIIISILLLMGIIKKKPNFVKIWLIIESIKLIVELLAFVVDLLFLHTIWSYVLNILFAIILAISIYLYIVVFSYYKTIIQSQFADIHNIRSTLHNIDETVSVATLPFREY